MGFQEGILLLLLAGAVFYLIKYIRKQYFSGKAEADDICNKCSSNQVRKRADRVRTLPKS